MERPLGSSADACGPQQWELERTNVAQADKKHRNFARVVGHGGVFVGTGRSRGQDCVFYSARLIIQQEIREDAKGTVAAALDFSRMAQARR